MTEGIENLDLTFSPEPETDLFAHQSNALSLSNPFIAFHEYQSFLVYFDKGDTLYHFFISRKIIS